jgi:hypothetical protein
LAARFVRDEEAAGSNPATPTQVRGPFLVMRSGPRWRREPGVGQGAAPNHFERAARPARRGCHHRPGRTHGHATAHHLLVGQPEPAGRHRVQRRVRCVEDSEWRAADLAGFGSGRAAQAGRAQGGAAGAASQRLCPSTRPQIPAGLAAVLTVAAIVLILFVLWRFYIDSHCTMVLGTQLCGR